MSSARCTSAGLRLPPWPSSKSKLTSNQLPPVLSCTCTTGVTKSVVSSRVLTLPSRSIFHPARRSAGRSRPRKFSTSRQPTRGDSWSPTLPLSPLAARRARARASAAGCRTWKRSRSSGSGWAKWPAASCLAATREMSPYSAYRMAASEAGLPLTASRKRGAPGSMVKRSRETSLTTVRCWASMGSSVCRKRGTAARGTRTGPW